MSAFCFTTVSLLLGCQGKSTSVVPILKAEVNELECGVPVPSRRGLMLLEVRLGTAISTFTCLFYHHVGE